MSDNRTKILDTWKNHTSIYQYGNFNVDGYDGFIAIDKTQNPSAWYIIVNGEHGIRGYTGFDKDANIANPDALLNSKDKMNLAPHEAFKLFGFSGNMEDSIAEKSIQCYEDTLDDPRLVAILPRKDLIKGEIKRMEDAGLATFKNNLNIDALNALKSQEEFLWKDYDFFANGGENHIYRKQAAEAYPLLTRLMSSRFSIRNAIDNQKSLQEALQNAFGEDEEGKPVLGKALLKRLRGLTYSLNGLTIEKIITTLSQLPPDWFPKDENEWNAFCDITATVGSILPKITGSKMDVLFQGCQGKWQVFKDRLVTEMTDTRPPEGMSEEAVNILNEYIDLNRFKKMPKEKVLAAATVLTEGLTSLPENVPVSEYENYAPGQILPYGIDREQVIDWITRMFAPTASRTAIQAACINVDDMVTIFNNKIIIPLAMNRSNEVVSYINQIIQEDGYRLSATMLFKDMAATAILSQARHFMTRVNEILAAGGKDMTDEEKMRREEARRASGMKKILGLPEDASDKAWPPLIAPVKAPNGLYIVPLTESYLLKDEGRGWGGQNRTNEDGSKGLGICVGEMNYDNKCRKNGHHILSVREVTSDGKSFKRLGCIEISKVKKDNTFTVNQFYADGNSRPGEKAQAALEWFKKSVASGDIGLNHDGIMLYLASGNKNVDEVMDLCGYNWRNRDTIMQAMMPWGKYVGKAFRKMNADMLAETPEILQISREINPNMDKEDNNAVSYGM